VPVIAHLRRVTPYYRPYRFGFGAGLVLVVISSAIGSVIPWLLRQCIDGIRSGAPASRIWWLCGLIVGSALVGGVLRYAMRELVNGVSRRIEYDIRNDLFVRLTGLDAQFFASMRTGDIMARLSNDLGAVRMAVGPAVMYLMNTIFGGLFALFFMLSISPMLTGLALVPLLLLPLMTATLGKKIHTRFEAVQEHFSTLTTRAQENLTGARIVRAYRQEQAEIDRFGAMNQEYLTRNMAIARLWGSMNSMFEFFGGAGAAVVLGVGGLLAARGRITVGEFVAFGMYLTMLTWPLIALGWVVNLFQRGDASMGRLYDILDARAAASTEPPIEHLLPASGGRTIEFRGVGFHYPTPEGQRARWVLRDIDLIVRAGATLGLVGATGSGKSSLLDLIPRLYDPQEGEILVDGIPIANLPLDELRAEMGIVPQESLLFSDTISSNLMYGAGNEADAREASGIARLDQTIRDFPGGYETMLGERGINLSGGQKQRAALARALARKPAIVLLDDALSAVDTSTEAEILRALGETLVGRTTIIASHRISAIRNASWIVVLEEGRIVEQGRHEDLLEKQGRYWSLLRRQQLLDAVEDQALAPAALAATI
jgi:ABC-type multidrug transport system, ATPase and permease components